MKLIDKDALVAEIDRLYDEKGAFYAADVLYNLKERLDTLDVKEVDLEKESASEDLEKFVDKYALTAKPNDWIVTNDGSATPVFFMSSIRDAMKCSAQWQKEQMEKDAISGFIFGSRYFRQKNISLTNLSEEQYDKLKDFGERIKVIIIKE